MKRNRNFTGTLVFSLILVLAAAMFTLDTQFPLPCELGFYNDMQVAASRGLTLEMVQRLRTQRSLSNPEICVMPQDKLDRAIYRVENPKPDHPGEAAMFRAQQAQDENGVIPADGIAKALQHVDRMPAIQLAPAERQGSSVTPGAQSSAVSVPMSISPDETIPTIEPADWVWKGPGNIGGRVRALMIHPTQPNRIWAGAVSGGIWYTENAGASWAPMDDFLLNLAVSTLVMDPTDPDTMYAGTGEGFYNYDAIRGAGVFKSTDGGVTWDQLASTATSDWYWVNRLAISPDGEILLAATRSGIWRSTNGGEDWTRVYTGEMLDVDFHPTDSAKAVSGGRYGSARYSTDGGVTWNWRVASFSGRVELAYAPSNPNWVYASVDQNNGQVHLSTDGGQSYALVNTGEQFLGAQGWYDNILWVDPTDEDRLIVGGIDLWASVDQGVTLEKISNWQYYPESVHADHHAIVAHPDFDGDQVTTVYFGNDGGVYKADDIYAVRTGLGDNGWTELNNQLGITQFYGAAGNPDSGVIIGGTQDNGTLRYYDGTENWDQMFGGDGGFCASDPTDPNYFYGEHVYLRIHRSVNGGGQSDYIYDAIYDERITDAENPDASNFIAPFILDPNNPETMLAGGDSLWRSTNVKTATPSWTPIKAPIDAGFLIPNEISAIAVAQGNSDIVWVGHNSGHIYRTSNGTSATPTWILVDDNADEPSKLPNRWVLRIVIDPHDPEHETVYATFGGFSGDNVYRTTDNGDTWTELTGAGDTGLPDVPVRGLAIHPDDSQRLYVGTEVGVFASEDGGASWGVPQSGPANVSVDELFWMGCKLVAATHGRGIYEINLCGNVEIDQALALNATNQELFVFQPGETIRWVITVLNNTGTEVTVGLGWDVRDPNGNPIFSHQEDRTVPDGWSGYYFDDLVGEIQGTYTFTGTVVDRGHQTQDVTHYSLPADVLFVDDDDNNPDVRNFYTGSLEASGLTYATWDTENSDREPDAAVLSHFPAVVWFTGGTWGNYTGPGADGETALADWLVDDSGCLMISSQDYLYNRGLTPFVQDYLGVDSHEDDVYQVVVTGTNTIYGSLGPYTLDYPFDNYSDQILPDASAELAFSGDKGDAAVAKSTEMYKTTFWGFPFEALPTAPDRQGAMWSFLNWCGLFPNRVYLPLVVKP